MTTKEKLELAHAKEMSKIAKEPLTAQLFENGDLFLFGSELGVLRIAYKYAKHQHNETNVGFSTPKGCYYVALYLFSK